MQHPTTQDRRDQQDPFARLYARQCHLIDAGRAQDWADTFTPDGVFISPTYPRPARGRDELAGIAESFADAAAEQTARHLLTTLAVEITGPETATARAYLQILLSDAGGSTQILRVMTVLDELTHTDGGWRVRSRRVHRDNP